MKSPKVIITRGPTIRSPDKNSYCIFANATQHFASIATATGAQIWPYHETVKGHPSLIIWTNLVDLDSPKLYTKIEPQSFLPYMGMAAILFSAAEPFKQTVNISSTEGPMWNLVITVMRILERRRLKTSWFYTCI